MECLPSQLQSWCQQHRTHVLLDDLRKVCQEDKRITLLCPAAQASQSFVLQYRKSESKPQEQHPRRGRLRSGEKHPKRGSLA